MPELTAAALIELAAGRQGHFLLESGHHSRLWLDLDAVFADRRRVIPFVTALANELRPYDLHAICGPLLGGAFLAQLVAESLAVEFYFTERVTHTEKGELYGAAYRLPPAFRTRVQGKRVAIVDDVMSAGSAARGTYAALQACGALPVVVGALLVLGNVGSGFFEREGVPVAGVTRQPFELWSPSACPLCAGGIHVEPVIAPAA